MKREKIKKVMGRLWCDVTKVFKYSLVAAFFGNLGLFVGALARADEILIVYVLMGGAAFAGFVLGWEEGRRRVRDADKSAHM